MTNEEQNFSYLELANRIIETCFYMPIYRDEGNNNARYFCKVFNSRIKFAKSSLLITHFCDYYDLDEEKIRKKIYDFNLSKLNQYKNYDTRF